MSTTTNYHLRHDIPAQAKRQSLLILSRNNEKIGDYPQNAARFDNPPSPFLQSGNRRCEREGVGAGRLDSGKGERLETPAKANVSAKTDFEWAAECGRLALTATSKEFAGWFHRLARHHWARMLDAASADGGTLSSQSVETIVNA